MAAHTEPTTGPASWEFIYTVSPDKSAPPRIQTRQLQATLPSIVYIDSWVLYDSLARKRQEQRLSPTAGKVIVTDTRYTDRGLVESTTLPQAVAGTPGTLLAPPNGAKWDNENATAYDEFGRPIWELFLTRGEYRWSTTKSYGHDTTTATQQPTGGETVTTIDAYGNTVKVAEFAERGNPASARVTSYTYDRADRLTKVTDPRGNTIAYTFDLAGRRTVVVDRDAGSWVYGYDLAGNETSVRDARHHGQPAPGTSTRVVSTWPVPGVTISDFVMPCHSAATMNSVLRPGPPNAQAKPPRSSSTTCSTVPPSATRTHGRFGTSAYQTAFSASTQMPSGTRVRDLAGNQVRSTSARRSRSDWVWWVRNLRARPGGRPEHGRLLRN